MYKETSYREKFAILSEWLTTIFSEIKAELIAQHLKKQPHFLRRYLQKRSVANISLEKMIQGYQQAIAVDPQGEALAESIAHFWMAKHVDIYDFFAQELKQINENFASLELIEDHLAAPILERALPLFGAKNCYLFCVLNSVVFSPTIYGELAAKSHSEHTPPANVSANSFSFQ